MDATAQSAQYRQKLRTPAEIAAMIQPGSELLMEIALSQPREIIAALGARQAGAGGPDITVHSLLDLYPFPWFRPDSGSEVRGVSWFSGGQARAAVNGGFADVMPCYYRDIPSLLRLNPQIRTVCVAVSPMDKHGYFSMGTNNSAAADILTRADCIFLEVNRQMPRSLSAPVIHLSQVTALCECDYALPVSPPPVVDEVSARIGGAIAAEVPDGATLQLGIGAVPDAVGMALKDKHDLGIHTELFTDSMMELIECGAVTNARKPIHRGKSVATFAFGSKRIYDYVDDNPAIEILPVDYVNDPKVIARHPDFISVNAAVEVDFFGQVCAESVGTRHVSGTGGQVDYVRGAVESDGGKSFIAFPSTAKGGEVSRIRPTLTPGSIVTTSKNDVDCIVTEYGIARLRGRTLSQRTRALIAVAHPKFRDELTFEAKKAGIL